MNPWNSLCLFPTKFSKSEPNFFSCQNRKSELSNDMLIISGSIWKLNVRCAEKTFSKISKTYTLSAVLNFRSLVVQVHFYLPLLERERKYWKNQLQLSKRRISFPNLPWVMVILFVRLFLKIKNSFQKFNSMSSQKKKRLPKG